MRISGEIFIIGFGSRAGLRHQNKKTVSKFHQTESLQEEDKVVCVLKVLTAGSRGYAVSLRCNGGI